MGVFTWSCAKFSELLQQIGNKKWVNLSLGCLVRKQFASKGVQTNTKHPACGTTLDKKISH